MHGILLLTALITLLFLVYGLFQLNQRVMRLEEKRRQMAQEKAANEAKKHKADHKKSDDIFHDLEGEALFYAMAGEYHQELEFSDDARKRFELVVRKHILEVLEKAKEGELSLEPDTIIRTLRGPVNSWLPPEVVNSFLIQGAVLSKNPKDEQAIKSIQSTIDRLYMQLGYQSPDDLLGLEDDQSEPQNEAPEAEPQKRAPGADGFM